MSETFKKWWQSKTIWSDILTIVVALYGGAQVVLSSHGINILPPVDGSIITSVLVFLGGMGIQGRVVAAKPIK